jgi:hypothetical protein
VFCDDSCEFAFNGVCDDGSDKKSESKAIDQHKHDDFGSYSVVYHCIDHTDCTDCGSLYLDTAPTNNPTKMPFYPPPGYCTNTCIYPRDGVCDDPRGGNPYCDLGTDCQDCGPIGADNFTRADDDGWWDDVDDYWESKQLQNTTQSTAPVIDGNTHQNKTQEAQTNADNTQFARYLSDILVMLCIVLFLVIMGFKLCSGDIARYSQISQQTPDNMENNMNNVDVRGDIEMMSSVGGEQVANIVTPYDVVEVLNE